MDKMFGSKPIHVSSKGSHRHFKVKRYTTTTHQKSSFQRFDRRIDYGIPDVCVPVGSSFGT
jgi:hypothetical protein